MLYRPSQEARGLVRAEHSRRILALQLIKIFFADAEIARVFFAPLNALLAEHFGATSEDSRMEHMEHEGRYGRYETLHPTVYSTVSRAAAASICTMFAEDEHQRAILLEMLDDLIRDPRLVLHHGLPAKTAQTPISLTAEGEVKLATLLRATAVPDRIDISWLVYEEIRRRGS